MDDFIKMVKIFDEIRASGNYSFFDNVPKEFLKSKEELNKLTAQAYKIQNKKTSHVCLFPGCKEKPIDSHSIQEAVIKSLADENGLLSWFSIKAEYKPNGKIEPKVDSISYHDASTFKGFCNKHDTSVFLPIEKNKINFGDKEQMFLILYRSVCKEYCSERTSWEKTREMSNSFINEDTDPNVTAFIIKDAYLKYCEFFWIEQIKQYLDLCLENSFFDIPFKYGCIELDYIPVYVNTFFSVCGAIEDISYIPDVQKEMPLFFSLSSFPDPKDGKLVFYYSFLREQEKDLAPFLRNIQSIDTLFKKRFVSDVILRNSDNFYISTDYWNSFPKYEKDKILDFFYRTVSDRWYDVSNDISLWR